MKTADRNKQLHARGYRRDPAAHRAHEAVRRAIVSGTLERPARCERCGAYSFIEASHVDYEDRLNVEWLCRSCHRKDDRHHQKNGAGYGIATASPDWVPPAERTHCPQGHEYTEKNTQWVKRRTGRMSRRCAECHREEVRLAKARKRASA